MRLILNVPQDKMVPLVQFLIQRELLNTAFGLQVSPPAMLPNGYDVNDPIVLHYVGHRDLRTFFSSVERVTQRIEELGGPWDLPGPACAKPIRRTASTEVFPGVFTIGEDIQEVAEGPQADFGSRVAAAFSAAYRALMRSEQNATAVRDLADAATRNRMTMSASSPTRSTRVAPADTDFEDFALYLQLEFARRSWSYGNPRSLSRVPSQAVAVAPREHQTLATAKASA